MAENINIQEKENFSEKSLAMELLKEVQIQSKRWMIAFIAVLIMWFLTIGGFVWYLNQYDFVSYSQDGGGYNNINTGEQGDVINGAEIPDKEKEER